MTLSELVDKLQALQSKHGNINVVVQNDEFSSLHVPETYIDTINKTGKSMIVLITGVEVLE